MVKSEEIEVLAGTSGSRLGFWRSRMRNSILKHLRRRAFGTRRTPRFSPP